MYFIRKYFYEPFLDHLIKKKYFVKTLTNACTTEKIKVETLETTGKELFEQFQKNAIKNYPAEENKGAFNAPSLPEPRMPVTSPTETDIAALSAAIKEEICHEFTP